MNNGPIDLKTGSLQVCGGLAVHNWHVNKPLYPFSFRSGDEGEAGGLVAMLLGGYQLGDPAQPPYLLSK